jgi:hypothetical protein
MSALWQKRTFRFYSITLPARSRKDREASLRGFVSLFNFAKRRQLLQKPLEQ